MNPRSPSASGCAPHEPRCWAKLPPLKRGGFSQDELIGYLIEHPGSGSAAVAKDFDVPLETISSHFYRGKLTTYVSRGKGWHVRPQAAKAYHERTGK